MPGRLMILGASILQLPAIHKAKEMGLEVVAVDIDKNAVGFKYADICLTVSTTDIPAVVAAAAKYKVNGVMTLASDMPMRTVAAVAEKCGLIGIDSDTALRATDKAVMRDTLKKHGVPIPEFHKVATKEHYDNITEDFIGRAVKFIVKPTDSSGSRGVYLVDTPSNRDSVEEAYRHSKEFSGSGEIIVEEYMEGPEVSVESISIDGECYVIQITDKLTTGAPFFVEMGHSQPTQLPPEVTDDIIRVTKMAVKAIGIKDGPSHTEIIATPTGAKIVELGARLGGDCIATHLVPLSTGVDMVKATINAALGVKPNITASIRKGAAIRYFDVPPGKILEISNLERAKAIDGIKEIHFVKSVGNTTGFICNSADRIGFVIAQGCTACDAIKTAEEARALVHIKVE